MNKKPIWDDYYNALKEYKELNNTLINIPSELIVKYKNKKLKLGYWVKQQRKSYKKRIDKTYKTCLASLSDEKFNKLNDIGFIFDPIKEKDNWNTCINLLKEYKKEYGNINVPINYKVNNIKLGIWLSCQKQAYQKRINIKYPTTRKPLSKNKITELEKLGIIWNKRTIVTKWDIMYELLEKYKEEFGNASVPLNYMVIVNGKEISLGRWLNNERKKYLDEIKKDKLNRLGISWKVIIPPKREENIRKTKWNIMYKVLVKYKETYGTANAPSNAKIEMDGKIYNIGFWLKQQRKAYHKKLDNTVNTKLLPLTDKQISLLNELEVKWESRLKINLDLGNGLKQYNVASIAKYYEIPVSSFYKYYAMVDYDINKTINIYNLNNNISTNKEIKLIDFINIFNISIQEVHEELHRNKIINKYVKTPKVVDLSWSLKDYCDNYGFDYSIVKKAFNLKEKDLCNESLNEILNRLIIDSKNNIINNPSSWIFTKYGNSNLLKAIIDSLSIDYYNVLNDMSNNAFTIEEAIANNIYKELYQNKYKYLANIFHNIVTKYNNLLDNNINSYDAKEGINNYIEEISKKYLLSSSELNVLKESVSVVNRDINKYHILDVMFSKNSDIETIKMDKYHLDYNDLLDNYYLPLTLDRSGLIGRSKEIYDRKLVIKEIELKWNDLDDASRNDLIEEFNLTTEEISFISKTKSREYVYQSA